MRQEMELLDTSVSTAHAEKEPFIDVHVMRRKPISDNTFRCKRQRRRTSAALCAASVKKDGVRRTGSKHIKRGLLRRPHMSIEHNTLFLSTQNAVQSALDT